MKRKKIIQQALAYLGFISLGLPDGLLGVAWSSIRASFNIPLDSLGSLLTATTLGYLLSSFNSGRMLSFTGVGTLLAISCLTTGLGLIGYALAPVWWVLILFGLLVGLGSGGIDAVLNAYAASNFNPRFLNWLHASFGIGTTIGPLIMTAAIASDRPWQMGYLAVAGIQIMLAFCFAVTLKYWRNSHSRQGVENSSLSQIQVKSIDTLKLPVVWVSMALFFIYSGVEVTTGQWSYSLLTEGRSISTNIAGTWISIYWGCLTVGRLLMDLLVNIVGTSQFLRINILGSIGGAIFIWLNLHNTLSLIGLALIGFSLAPIYPSLISATPQQLGIPHATNAIGFQVSAASLGMALLPGFAGILAKNFGLEIIGLFLIAISVIMFLLYRLLEKMAVSQNA